MELQLDAVGVAGIVEDVTLNVAAGEVVAVVGPNGSGKSTTLRCVYRSLKPTAGVVLVDGQDVDAMRHPARSIAALTQEGQIEFDFTVAEIVAMGRLPHKNTFDRDTAEDHQICRDSLQAVDAEHLAERGFRTLSGGERQRVLIARALAQRPHILVLDEPTNHLDIRHQLDVLALARGLGLTVLTVLHDLNLAASYCDRLYVLDSGRVVASGKPVEVLTPQLLQDVFGVRVHVISHPTTGVPQLLFDHPEKL